MQTILVPGYCMHTKQSHCCNEPPASHGNVSTNNSTWQHSPQQTLCTPYNIHCKLPVNSSTSRLCVASFQGSSWLRLQHHKQHSTVPRQEVLTGRRGRPGISRTACFVGSFGPCTNAMQAQHALRPDRQKCADNGYAKPWCGTQTHKPLQPEMQNMP